MTPHQEALAERASEPQPAQTTDTSSFSGLGLEATEIFDETAVFEDLQSAIGETADSGVVRKATVTVLKEAQARGRERVAKAIAEAPLAAHPAVRAYSHLTDGLVRTVFRVTTAFSTSPWSDSWETTTP